MKEITEWESNLWAKVLGFVHQKLNFLTTVKNLQWIEFHKYTPSKIMCYIGKIGRFP